MLVLFILVAMLVKVPSPFKEVVFEVLLTLIVELLRKKEADSMKKKVEGEKRTFGYMGEI